MTFFDFPYPASARKLGRDSRPLLKDLCVVEFRAGSNSAWVKRDFDGEFERFDYLRKYLKQAGINLAEVPGLREGRRGIPQDKYNAILQDLVPLILEVDNGRHSWRAEFYRNLHTSDGAADLASSDDPDPADEHS